MSTKLQTRRCCVCRTKFTTYRTGQEACSRKCGAEHRRRKTRIPCKCLTCHKRFTVTPSDKAVGRGLYCSRRCSGNRAPAFDVVLAMTLWEDGRSARQVAIAVEHDEIAIRRWLRRLGIYEPRHARGKQTHNWKGGAKSYRKHALQVHGKRCDRCGYARHPAILQVHHKDRDRQNNNIQNLIPLCPTCHEEVHYEEKTGRYDPAKGQ